MRPTLRRSVRAVAVTITVTLAATVSLAVTAGSASATSVVPVSPTQSIKLTMRGNGHGHGMSQYGARGAALAGKSTKQILAYYYPGTTLTRLPATWIHVRLSGFGSVTPVGAYSELTVTGVSGVLPISGVRQYRLVANSGTGLTLQRLMRAKGSKWTNYQANLPDGAGFHRNNNWSIQLYAPDGTSVRYYGRLRAYRNHTSGPAGGVYTINVTTLDRYAAGVAPREMPASWPGAAVAAQSVAARTYGMYEIKHPQSAHYDICDTTQCQVYGGHTRYDSRGGVLWRDDPTSAAATSYQVLKYGGKPIFSQFAASNGGWAVDGGQPYLTSHVDAYDTTKSGDPYLGYTTKIKVSSLASYFGLAKVTAIAVTKRDGHGAWGGRVLSGYVAGTDRSGNAKKVTVTGFDLQYAFGIGTTWFSISARA